MLMVSSLTSRANRKLTISVPRHELVSYLRQSIQEQRRTDATYALVDQAGSFAHAIAVGEQKPAEVEIKLILPPELNSARGTKGGKAVRKHRHTTKVCLADVYYMSCGAHVLTRPAHLLREGRGIRRAGWYASTHHRD
jgi:hypothetical protein